MQVPATDAVTAQLAAALAELHTEASWSCYDSGVDETGYFTRALRVAGEAGEPLRDRQRRLRGREGRWVRNGYPTNARKLF